TQVSRRMALLISAIYAATPVVQLTTGALFTDNLWTAFLLCAAIAILEWSRHPEPGYPALAGLFLGAALATKLVALGFVLACLVWIFTMCFSAAAPVRRQRLSGALRAVVLLAIIAAPPYLTAYIKTGNPVFPFLNGIFRSPYFDATKSYENVSF